MGICLPLYFVHTADKPINVWDAVAVVVAMTGVVVAYFSDTQLYDFVSENELLKEAGKPAVSVVLDRGLWYYSRHPNYFGEQLWWWGVGIFAWNLGYPWAFVGALVNSLCLAYVTILVERRMLEKKERAEAYRLYQRRTSVLIPWFKASDDDDSAKEKSA